MSGNGGPQILGECPAIRRAVDLARRFAPTGIPILLVGATGTGKDLFARAIHEWSGRAGRLLDINCGGLPRELVDGMLFGHRRGAFTGAVDAASGLLEAAEGGTVFLDELCSLPPEGQVKLLRVLETGVARRLGEATDRRVDFRVISAVRDGLDRRVELGEVRLDLLQRISGVMIELPALALRGQDVVRLASHFVAGQGRWLSSGVAELLLAQAWPGNVRELKTVVERACWLTSEAEIDVVTMAEAIALGPLADRTNGGYGERARMLATLESCGWNAGKAAKLLGIGRSTLFARSRSLGISIRSARRTGESRPVPDAAGLSDSRAAAQSG